MNYSYDSAISHFCCHKCNQNARMKEARGGGQNNFFRNASLLMWYCSFAIGHFLTLKSQSEKQDIVLLFKVRKRAKIWNRHNQAPHLAQDTNSNQSATQIRVVFYVHPPFVNFTVLSMEFPIRNCLPFFFQTVGNFYQIILSHSQGRSQNNSLIKNFKCHLR